jgi:SAM-dependent methyltransferase
MTGTARPTEREYILGTGDDELQRLGFQHRVWSAEAFALWERAGFGPGQRLIDAGCGPGFTSLDLAQLVGPQGAVLAVDESARFIAHLRAWREALGLPWVAPQVGDVQRLDLPAGSCDGAYLRWVLCFVADPAAVLAGLARALRPGGRLAISDYFHYRGMRLLPGGKAFDEVIAVVVRSWEASGGDSNIGQRLPALLAAAGFELKEAVPLVRSARPGTTLWSWPTTFFRNFLPTLVQRGLLTQSQCDGFQGLWAAHAADPAAVFFTPPMAEIIAVKR